MLHVSGTKIEDMPIRPAQLVELLALLEDGHISANSAKQVLHAMLETGADPQEIIAERGLKQVSNAVTIAQSVQSVLSDHPEQVESFLAGKETLSNWFFGKVMRTMGGKATPQVVRSVLQEALQNRVNTSKNQ